MFKKKPNIKPLAPLRSSDRRRTADQIIKDLDLETPAEETTNAEEKAAAAAEKSSLRNALLPDNSLSARFTTTHGPDLKQVSGTVYVGSHDGEEQRVLWVSLEGRMYPTVYTLWHNPGIIPLLHCGSNVVARLQGGADLMTPGLIGGPPFPVKAIKGAIVAIAGHDRPSVPVVVGTCEIDVSQLKETRGAKGHAVETFHWSGDEIWSWNAAGRPGTAPPEHLEGWLDEGGNDDDDELEDLKDQANDLTLKEQNKADSPPTIESSRNGDMAQEDSDAEPEKEMTVKEIDEAFKNAFLYGINHFKTSSPDARNYGLDFPLTQTVVMSTLVNPFLPTFTQQQINQLQIKKTSWKSIKKFIKFLDKQRIVKSKDRDGNEAVITDVDFDDRSILEFKPYRLPKKDTTAGTSQRREGQATEQLDSGGDPSIGQNLKLLSLYRPKEKLADLFAALDTGPFYSAAEVKSAVYAYIEHHELVSATNKRIAKLDPFLANSVFDGKGSIDREVLAKGTVLRDILAERVLSSCSPFYLLARGSESTGSSKPKAGSPPKVSITLETRSGNKTVTKVSGLETYFIPPQPLADELRKACAGSTSVERLAASSPKNPVMEVMIQGPQKDAIIKALEKRGVDKRWIDVIDKTKGKKKG